MIFSPESEISIEKSYQSRKYNEKEENKSIVRRDKLSSGIRWCVILLEGEGTVEKIAVDKSKTGTIIPDAESLGLSLSLRSGRYDICFIRNEFRYGGYLLRCGKAEAYARVFFRKDGDETVRVRC